jgi:hypothetical protein
VTTSPAVNPQIGWVFLATIPFSERRNRETEKKGGERERERGEKRMGDYGGTAGPGLSNNLPR